MTYLYLEEEPLYSFGYGLSYSDFASEIQLQRGGEGEIHFPCGTADTMAGEVTVWVKNTGKRTSDTVVQIYRKKDGGYRLYEPGPHPGDRLTAFTRLKDIMPGEERTIILACRY